VGPGGDDIGSVCEPGAPALCVCPDGTTASKDCDPTGSAFGLCSCSAAPALAGSAGTGGTGGSAPPVTTPGSAGAAGQAPGSRAPDEPEPPMTAGMNGASTGAGGADAMSWGGRESEGDDGVPPGPHCEAVATWEPMWIQFEQEVLLRTNEARAQGASCGEEGSFPPAAPLSMNAELRCSARRHSKDMGVLGYFAHDSQNGEDPFDRMSAAGYTGRLMGENIAKGQQSPEEVVEGWLESPGHCANIMNDGFSDIGIGYWEGEADNQWFNGNKLWTQNFGAPSSGGNGGCPWGPQFCQ
jgi:uncharacterized protein YkwD